MASTSELFAKIYVGRGFPYIGVPQDMILAQGFQVIYGHCVRCGEEIRVVGSGGWWPEGMTCGTCWSQTVGDMRTVIDLS